jgi:hypothetical protein
MAKLTISDAARVAGVARSTLHRAIHAGRLSVDADGRLDTAELLRAGYTLQRSVQQRNAGALQDATPRTSDAQHPRASAENEALMVLQQERDLLRLERDLLLRELEAVQGREQAALVREQDARDERQAAREREALLLHMLQEMQQRYDRLLDAPHQAASAPLPQAPAPVRAHRPPRSGPSAYDPSPAIARILTLRQQGLSFEAIAAQLTQEGIPTRYGLPWQHSSVRYLWRTYGEEGMHD